MTYDYPSYIFLPFCLLHSNGVLSTSTSGVVDKCNCAICYHICDNACRRSPANSLKCMAFCPVSRFLSVTIYFKLYSFYNNNTRLQISHEVILLGVELIRNIFSQGIPLEFLSWQETPILHMPVKLTPRLAHRINHSAT